MCQYYGCTIVKDKSCDDNDLIMMRFCLWSNCTPVYMFICICKLVYKNVFQTQSNVLHS